MIIWVGSAIKTSLCLLNVQSPLVFTFNLCFTLGFICFLINQASSQATSQEIPTTTEEILSTTEYETIGEESVILTSPGYPNSYLPTSSFKILRKVEPGYQIDIKLNDLDLSVKDGDYLSISSGKTIIS